MLERIQQTIAIFLKVPADRITPSTVINRAAVGNSIVVHRMYAKLAAEGIVVRDYQEVNTVTDLLQRINGSADKPLADDLPGPAIEEGSMVLTTGEAGNGIGIDMEEIAAMPVTNDFREDEFYKMNFTPAEMAYCILQSNPYASFAGLFAAKEAIVKADNSYKEKGFNQLSIQHLPDGRPVHFAFRLSISHTDSQAIAIALPLQEKNYILQSAADKSKKNAKVSIPAALWILALSSFVLSLIAFFFLIRR